MYVLSIVVPVERAYTQVTRLEVLEEFPRLTGSMKRAKQHHMDKGGLSEAAQHDKGY